MYWVPARFLGAGCATVHRMAMILKLMERVLVENTGDKNMNTNDIVIVSYVKEKDGMLPEWLIMGEKL